MEKKYNLKKTFLITMIISLSISALIGIFIFLLGDFGELESKLLLTTLTVGGYSLTGLCCSVLYERRKFTLFAQLGMLISVLGFFYTVLIIWEVMNTDSANIFKGLLIFIILTISTAHSSLLLLIRPGKKMVTIALMVTIVFIAIVALMLMYLVLMDFGITGEFYFRLLGVFAILDVLGTIVSPILNKVTAISGDSEPRLE